MKRATPGARRWPTAPPPARAVPTVPAAGCCRGFNDLATAEPEVAGQWHPDLNGALRPDMVTAGSHKKVWWQCPEGHVWKTVVYSRTGPKKCGCPVCAGKVKPRT